MALRRSARGYLENLLRPIAPTVDRYGEVGTLCMTCGRRVDYEEMVEGLPGRDTYCRVLVRHHGAEEMRTFSFDSVEWDDRDLKRAMQAATWFAPTSDAVESPHAQVPAGLDISGIVLPSEKG